MGRGMSVGFGQQPFTLVANHGLYGIYSAGAQLNTGTPGGITFAQNRPAGLTTVIDRQWDPTDPSIPGGVLPPSPISGTDSFNMAWFNGTGSPASPPIIDTPANLSTTIGKTVPAMPDGHSTCMAIFYASGFTRAEVPFILEYVGGFSLPCQKMYHCCWVNMPSNFRSTGNNIKWLDFQHQDPGISNHILMLSSQDNTSDGRAAWMVTQGGGGTNSYGGQGANASGAITSLAVPPPQGTGVGWWASNYDSWHLCEWFVQRETTPGVSSDGIFKAWFDGVLINSWANIKYNAASGDANGFNVIQLNPYYGGGGVEAPANEYICLGHFLVAAA